MPSRPGEFHPEPLTEPDLILSHHPARAMHPPYRGSGPRLIIGVADEDPRDMATYSQSGAIRPQHALNHAYRDACQSIRWLRQAGALLFVLKLRSSHRRNGPWLGFRSSGGHHTSV